MTLIIHTSSKLILLEVLLPSLVDKHSIPLLICHSMVLIQLHQIKHVIAENGLWHQLAFVMVDEYSMKKADMLYQTHFRLQEMKENTNIPFGCIALIILVI